MILWRSRCTQEVWVDVRHSDVSDVSSAVKAPSIVPVPVGQMACPPARPAGARRWCSTRRRWRRSLEEIDRSTPRDLISRSPGCRHPSRPSARPSVRQPASPSDIYRDQSDRENRRRVVEVDPPRRPWPPDPSPSPTATRRSKNGRILLTRRTGWRVAADKGPNAINGRRTGGGLAANLDRARI